ncbi:Glutathione peroxidase (plasmid) [Borrelia parkeri SLO]|uniref:Glutathione peroxidase n=1 Tax=Borrelia parkeri SLO TaxID=1313294 RepID=W5SQG3_BORPR|nr:Glutathione peroxidase [Borrelia parkeri SLO]AHH10154.1 Glutathione peroxidase [Borrelia parkeri SLO]
MGFFCNQFGFQEPGTNDEIKKLLSVDQHFLVIFSVIAYYLLCENMYSADKM